MRSYLSLRRVQLSLRRQHYTTWTWIQRLAALLNVQGYGIISREVSTIEPTPAMILSNVSGRVDYRSFRRNRQRKQARVCKRPLSVTNKILRHSSAEKRSPRSTTEPAKAHFAVYWLTRDQLIDIVPNIFIIVNGQRQLATHLSQRRHHHAREFGKDYRKWSPLQQVKTQSKSL